MASPPSSKPGPTSPPAQESPFSSFVSSLSPINAVCVRNALHTDLGVPSPQPVFTSPHINFPRKRDLSKRFQKQAFSGSEKFPLFALNNTEFPENSDISGSSCLQSMTQLIPCSQKECNKDGPSQDPFSSPSSCVDEFLADHIEACDDPVEVPQIELTDYNETNKDCKKENLRQIQPPGKLMTVSDGGQYVILSKSAIMEEDTTIFHPLNTMEGLKMDVSDNLTSLDHTEGNILKERSSGNISHTEIESGLKQTKEVLNIGKRSHEKQLGKVVTANDDQIDPDRAIDPASSPCRGLDVVGPICADHLSLMPNDNDWSRMDSGKQNYASSSVCSEAVGDVNLRLVQNEQWPDCGLTFQVVAESIPDIQDNDQQDNSGARPNACTDDKVTYDQEDGAQHQRAMRKRLQFEGFDNHLGWKENYRSFTSAICDSESPGTSIDLDNACVDSAPPPSKELLNQLVNLSGNAHCKLSLSACKRSKVDIGAQDQSYRYEGSSSLIAPTPSGIGLHLNSIGGSAPKSFNINMQCREKDLEVSTDKSVSGGHKIVLQQSNYPCPSRIISPYPSVKPISRFNNSLSHSAVENKRVDLQEKQEIEPSALDVKPHDVKISPSEDACSSKELTQMSPKKKRKKASDNDGSKRCHCKRSKCLKLYCDCFAAGTLCSEDCACQGCFNKPEHQEKVQETRQQIETRNPLAFAPKVVLRVTEPQKDSGESKHITPTSARHKRGCNCKKSQCLKKYCECYQVGVGCSLGCRCEGCKNTFGRKDGSCEVTEMEYKFLQREMKNKKLMEADLESDSSCEKLGVILRKGASAADGCVSRLSPLTPLFQTSDENDVPKAQPPVSYYPSPESGSSALLSYNESPSSPKGSKGDNSLAKAREDTLALVPCDQDLNGASAAKVDPFSPRWDGFSDICDISPMSNPLPSVTGSAAITSVRERRGLQTKLFHGSSHLSAGLRWRSSPVTPLPRFGDGKFIIEPDSGSGLRCNIDDDTPDVLKDASSPARAVTASSPNKKRVSPPAKCLHETGSSTSPAIKSGRKFILKSVPSFPPLTPYSNKR